MAGQGHTLRVAIKDFTTDDSLAFVHLLKEAGALPDWLETAAEASDVSALPDVAFADTHRRLMPMHNKSATFLSAVSACVYGYPSGSWENRLKAACHSYGISDIVKKAHEVLTPEEYHEKAASQTTKIAHALELVIEPGQEPKQFYPIDCADSVESSAVKLAADMFAQKLPGTWFAEAADNLVKAANEMGMPLTMLPASVRAMAEDRLPSPEYLSEQIERRQKQASLPDEVVSIYRQSAEAALEKQASIMDAAHVWELADRKFGIRLTDTVSSPVTAFRSGMTRDQLNKLAGEYTTIAGVQVPFNQLTTVPDELVAAVLPLKVASCVVSAKNAYDGVKAAAVLGTLEETEQLMVLELLADRA